MKSPLFRFLACVMAIGGIAAVIVLKASSEEAAYRPAQVISQPFQPITEFETKTVEQVGMSVNPDELIIGVVVNGEARAYPINMLTGPDREIINDSLGGTKLAATW